MTKCNLYAHHALFLCSDLASPAPLCVRWLLLSGWTKFLEDKYSGLKGAERDGLVERMSIIQENPWVKDEM